MRVGREGGGGLEEDEEEAATEHVEVGQVEFMIIAAFDGNNSSDNDFCTCCAEEPAEPAELFPPLPLPLLLQEEAAVEEAVVGVATDFPLIPREKKLFPTYAAIMCSR